MRCGGNGSAYHNSKYLVWFGLVGWLVEVSAINWSTAPIQQTFNGVTLLSGTYRHGSVEYQRINSGLPLQGSVYQSRDEYMPLSSN